MNAFAVRPELETEVYPHLLNWAAQHAAHFHLVLPHGLDFEKSASVVLRKLQRATLRVGVTQEWAGTTAMDAARVVECSVTAESIAILREEAGIFAWLYPRLPEDLAFFTADRRCVFNSVSHHEEAWVCDMGLKDWIETEIPGSLLETKFTASAVTFERKAI